MSDLFPEDLFATWNFQDHFTEIALTLIEHGAHLGALAAVREVLVKQTILDRKLRTDELKDLPIQVKIEIRAEAEKGYKNARGS